MWRPAPQIFPYWNVIMPPLCVRPYMVPAYALVLQGEGLEFESNKKDPHSRVPPRHSWFL